VTDPVPSIARAVTCRKGALGFAVERHSMQATWVVADSALVVCSDRHLIDLRIDVFDAAIVAGPDAKGHAATAVTHDAAARSSRVERPAVGQVDVEPAIAVVIDEYRTGPGGLENVVLRAGRDT
jgi:hypothetical protein